MKKLSDDEIIKTYQLIQNYYDQFLKKYGVIIPKLRKDESGNYSKDVLTFIK